MLRQEKERKTDYKCWYKRRGIKTHKYVSKISHL
jgi:hypothetical protein